MQWAARKRSDEMKNLKRSGVLIAFLLTLVIVTMAAAQENKNRRGDGGSAPPPKAAKNAAPSQTEAQLKDEQANAPSDSNKEVARRARLERHRRNP
jgi:hypothetical protein